MKRQCDDAAADPLGVRKVTLLPAEAAVQREQVDRRIVHAGADPGGAHARYELPAPDAQTLERQNDLKHVPVRLLEVGHRKPAAQALVEAREVVPRELAPARGERVQPGELTEADARRDVGEIELVADDVHVHAVLARAGDALEAQLLGEPRGRLVGHYEVFVLAGRDVLVRMKAECDEIASRADACSAPGAAESLRG